jgi:hypothetical protein
MSLQGLFRTIDDATRYIEHFRKSHLVQETTYVA